MRSDWFFLGRDFTIRTISMETVISRVFTTSVYTRTEYFSQRYKMLSSIV